MKNKLILLSLSVLLLNCKKENDNPQPVAVYPNYSNLAIGNYWIYEIYKKDSLGNSVFTGSIDSVYVNKDSVIRGNKYFFIQTKQIVKKDLPYLANSCNYGQKVWRDSSGFIVGVIGEKYFASEPDIVLNSGRILGPSIDTTVITYITKTQNKETTTLPIGILETINAQTVYNFNVAYTKFQKTRYSNLRFSKDIGLVEKTLCFYTNSNEDYVWRLKHYGKN